MRVRVEVVAKKVILDGHEYLGSDDQAVVICLCNFFPNDALRLKQSFPKGLAVGQCVRS